MQRYARSPDGQAGPSGGYPGFIFDDVSNAIRGPSIVIIIVIVIVAVVVVVVVYLYNRSETLTLRHTDLSLERKPSAAVGVGVFTSERDSATELELSSTLIKTQSRGREHQMRAVKLFSGRVRI